MIKLNDILTKTDKNIGYGLIARNIFKFTKDQKTDFGM